MSTDNRPEVLVIGGGFAGVKLVQGLRKAPVSITLIDRQNHHLFQPLLYQVATAALPTDDIATPIRGVFKKQQNVTVGMAELKGADLKRKVVYGSRGERGYDYLVLAMGVDPSYYGHDEFQPHAPGLKNLNDALEIRRRILMAFEEAEFEADEAARRGKLTFVVVGGGPTGVELSGAIMETASRTLPREFRNIDTRTARVILVQGGDGLLKGMPEKMGQHALQDLKGMGVEVRLNSHVTEVDDHGVVIGDERVPAENVLWAAGVQGTPLAKTLGVELDHMGRVIVGPDLSIPHYPHAFVIGDAAHALDPETGQPVPGVAQGAIQMGHFVAEVLTEEVKTGFMNLRSPDERPVFHYRDKGSMATISRGKAVASINGRILSGFIGWLAWGLIHIMFLVGYRNKFAVMTEWIGTYISSQRSSRLITGDPKTHIKEVRGVRMFDDKHD